jgi:lysophospholipid acyltransferase (LPLAT)-like uncharacterized protein
MAGAKGISKHFKRRPPKWVVFCVSALASLALKILASTWRIRYVGGDLERDLERRYGAVIYAFWHGRLLMPAATHSGRKVRIMVSEARDGEWVAALVERMGFKPIRGSTSRGGRAALKHIVKDARKGYSVAITPDGPRGPFASVGPGALFLARLSGLPIVPAGVTARDRWEMPSWDKFQIPKPFTTVVLLGTKAIIVPRRAGEEEIEKCREELREALIQMNALAERVARGEIPPPKLQTRDVPRASVDKAVGRGKTLVRSGGRQ